VGCGWGDDARLLFKATLAGVGMGGVAVVVVAVAAVDELRGTNSGCGWLRWGMGVAVVQKWTETEQY
jgi:hypothetical protein